MKQLCIQQAYLDGWERCRLTMAVKMRELIETGCIVEAAKNSACQVEFAGHNPTCKELNEYQDGGWQSRNAPLLKR